MAKTPEKVRKQMPFTGDERVIKKRFNIAPTQSAAVIVRPDTLTAMRWGLIPKWAQDEAIGNRMINARSETVASKPAFKPLLPARRCLVLADGFYEWQQTKSGGKQPYYFQLADGEPFAFAGLWDQWQPPKGDPIQSFTILTTDANAAVQPVHHRMPVILPAPARERWLAEGPITPSAMEEILRPLPGEAMRSHPVDTLVNSPRNDVPQCIAPLGKPTDPQGTLF